MFIWYDIIIIDTVTANSVLRVWLGHGFSSCFANGSCNGHCYLGFHSYNIINRPVLFTRQKKRNYEIGNGIAPKMLSNCWLSTNDFELGMRATSRPVYRYKTLLPDEPSKALLSKHHKAQSGSQTKDLLCESEWHLIIHVRHQKYLTPIDYHSKYIETQSRS